MAISIQHQRDVIGNDHLCLLGNILAIIPPHTYLIQDKTGRRRCWYKWYTFVILSIILCGDIHSIWGRSRYSYPFLKTYTLMVTDLAVNLSTVAANILTVIIPTFCHTDDFFLFKDMFLTVDNHLQNGNGGKKKKCRLFYIELIVGHLIFFSIVSYDAYVWITGLGMTIYLNYVFRYFQNYHLFITVMLMYNAALSMYCKLKQTNSKLQDMLSSAIIGHSNSEPDAQPEKFNIDESARLRKISKTYEKQILQINLYNKIFGWQILILTLSVMMGLLNALDTITVFVLVEDGYESSRFGMNLIILGCLTFLWQFLLGILVTASCDTAWREAQLTGEICFSILLKLPIIAETKQEKALQDELALLSQMVTQRCPEFSAAGFFNIDYRLVLAIFGSVTSYVIVLIQFNK